MFAFNTFDIGQFTGQFFFAPAAISLNFVSFIDWREELAQAPQAMQEL